MSINLLYGERPAQVTEAQADGQNLWLSLPALSNATGWELKPEGACLGEVCVPIPTGREADFLRANDGAEFNLAALARLRDQPVVHNDEHGVWFFGEAANARGTALASLEAPNFSLPDLDGKMHSLSDYRGKKVLLMSWASW